MIALALAIGDSFSPVRTPLRRDQTTTAPCSIRGKLRKYCNGTAAERGGR
jgi:hypothetical protein